MNSVGIDLHKKTISVCVVDKARKVICRKTFPCSDPSAISQFFSELDPFQAVVEACASYEWLVKIIEPMADRVILAHPYKLRVIAESTRKSDRLDAQVLAEFLALDMIPEAFRPGPRQRDHRVLVRQRSHITRMISRVKTKLRRILDNYNADRPDLFTSAGRRYLGVVDVSPADRFTLDQLAAQLVFHQQQQHAIEKKLEEFAAAAPIAEAEARAVLHSIPYVGPVTVDIVVSEVGDVRRFRRAKQVAAYAGLTPVTRESGGRRKELGIAKQGSRLLRWILIEVSWRLVCRVRRWAMIFERLSERMGKKKAIVAVARKLLCVMASLIRSGRPYAHAVAG